MKYNHAFTIAFAVITDKKDPNEITEKEFADALRARIRDIESGKEDDFRTCCGKAFDSYEIEGGE